MVRGELGGVLGLAAASADAGAAHSLGGAPPRLGAIAATEVQVLGAPARAGAGFELGAAGLGAAAQQASHGLMVA